VTDPHNVGAVIRSCVAFGASALLLTRRHSPSETGVLAKTASGALEHLPILRETNLARALETLKDKGFHCAGLAGEASAPIADLPRERPLCLVLGAEGKGLRQKTRETCDSLVRLPTLPPIDQLNVSNAAAISLYEVLGREVLGREVLGRG
jgi:23S rRNA (guanosine2251-2'-O)-methyltransferase